MVIKMANRGGRPRKSTTDEIIKAVHDAKGMLTIAAKNLGVSYVTMLNYQANIPEVAQAVKDARNAMLDAAELKLYTKAVKDGDTTALIFLLKTQGRIRGYNDKLDINANVSATVSWADFVKQSLDGDGDSHADDSDA
jgi:hypothetical protein